MPPRLENTYEGKAHVVGTRIIPQDAERLDRIRETKGLSRAGFIRYAIKAVIDAEEASAKASKASQAA